MLVSAPMDVIDSILSRVPELRAQGVARVELERSGEAVKLVVEILPAETQAPFVERAPARQVGPLDDPATYGAAISSPYADLVRMRSAHNTAPAQQSEDTDPDMRDHY